MGSESALGVGHESKVRETCAAKVNICFVSVAFYRSILVRAAVTSTALQLMYRCTHTLHMMYRRIGGNLDI